jgi:hypothetical protein
MRQRTTAEFSDLTGALIYRIERGGCAVSVHRMGDYVEAHAVELKEPCAQHSAAVWDGDGEEHQYRRVLAPTRMRPARVVCDEGVERDARAESSAALLELFLRGGLPEKPRRTPNSRMVLLRTSIPALPP